MKEKNKYPKEREMLNSLIKNASEARRFYLKYEVMDNIMSLLKFNNDDDRFSEGSKWEKLYRLQKRIIIVNYDLGESEADVLMQEILDTISEYLNKNKIFREEAYENIKMFSDIQKKKVKTLEQIFRVVEDYEEDEEEYEND